jgi:hypothetical protein
MQLNKTYHSINPRYNILHSAPCPIQHRSYHNKTKLQKVFKMFCIHSHIHATVKHHKAFVVSKTSPFPRTMRCTNMIHTLLCCQFLCLLETTCELHITNYLYLWPTWLSDFSFKRASTRQHLFNCEGAIREVQGNH